MAALQRGGTLGQCIDRGGVPPSDARQHADAARATQQSHPELQPARRRRARRGADSRRLPKATQTLSRTGGRARAGAQTPAGLHSHRSRKIEGALVISAVSFSTSSGSLTADAPRCSPPGSLGLNPGRATRQRVKSASGGGESPHIYSWGSTHAAARPPPSPPSLAPASAASASTGAIGAKHRMGKLIARA